MPAAAEEFVSLGIQYELRWGWLYSCGFKTTNKKLELDQWLTKLFYAFKIY